MIILYFYKLEDKTNLIKNLEKLIQFKINILIKMLCIEMNKQMKLKAFTIRIKLLVNKKLKNHKKSLVIKSYHHPAHHKN